MHRVDDLAVCLGDINRHVGRHINGFGVHGGHGVGQRNMGRKWYYTLLPGEGKCMQNMRPKRDMTLRKQKRN